MWQKISNFSQKLTILSLITKLALFSFGLGLAYPASAYGELEISNIEVEVSQEKVMIKWYTNIPANGRIEYGLTNEYGRQVTAQINPRTNHEINLFGLLADEDYHFRIVAYTADQEVSSFDQVFNTDDIDDNVIPDIEVINIPYVAGTVATIQWQTSELTSGIVYYGKTIEYGKKVSVKSRRLWQEVTLTKLSPGTLYHFKVEVKDKDGNKQVGQDITFRTLITDNADRETLANYNIRPVSSKDAGITNRSAVITWQSNKLASALVRYGTSADKLKKKVSIKDSLKSFDHRIEITGLKPETQYYYQVETKDVFGKSAKSEIKSFTTQALPVSAGQNVSLAANRANKTAPSVIYKVGDKLYALLNGRKHYVKNPNIFQRNGYSWSSVKIASSNQVNNLPDVKLVKSPDNATVYYLYKKANDQFIKLAIPNAKVFTSYPQNSWSQIVTIDKLDLDSYQDVKLIKGIGDKTVYLLENNTKRPIISTQSFLDRGYNWSDIVEVNQTHLLNYPTGANLQ